MRLLVCHGRLPIEMPPQPDDYLQPLRAAIDGLTYPSESDEPFDLIQWIDGRVASARDALVARVDRTRRIEQVPNEMFFAQLDTAENAEEYRRLRRTLESLLRDLTAFRVGAGEVRVDIYLIGRIPAGWAALHTVSVET